MASKTSLHPALPRLAAHAVVFAMLAGVLVGPHPHAFSVVGGRQLVEAADTGAERALPVPRRTPSGSPPITGDSGPVQQRQVSPPGSTARPQPVQTAGTPIKEAASPPRQGWGNDISWPQCDGDYPTGTHDIGVVGVTGGRPFTSNPCLASQFAWARSSKMPGGAQVYVNLEIDGTSSGPHNCGADDHRCRSYDYGMTITFDAIARAHIVDVTPGFWWLDVEVGNNWSEDHKEWNQATIQGAIDAAHSRGVDVGIYSSAEQWAQIVPASFRPAVPTWLAVVGEAKMAPGLCNGRHSLTAGPVYMVQYDDNEFDKDHVCAAGTSGFAVAAGKRPR